MGNENLKYDVLIVGAGPIGLACGIEAQKRSLSHIIIEKGNYVARTVIVATGYYDHPNLLDKVIF